MEKPAGIVSLTVSSVRPIPPVITMLFSEAINHLRSAIDNTVFYCVERTHGTLDEGLAREVALPIYSDPAKLSKWFERRKLAELGPASELAPRISALQPFVDASTVPSTSRKLGSMTDVEVVHDHPLLLLQAYSNEDKHRTIRVAAARTLVQRDDQPFRDSDRSMRPIEPGDVLAVTPIGTPVMVDTSPAVMVERPGRSAWVAPGRELDLLRTHVADVVIPTLTTGLSIPHAFPPGIDLSDTGLSVRERIEDGTHETAHERMAPFSYRAWLQANSAPPRVPRTVQGTEVRQGPGAE